VNSKYCAIYTFVQSRLRSAAIAQYVCAIPRLLERNSPGVGGLCRLHARRWWSWWSCRSFLCTFLTFIHDGNSNEDLCTQQKWNCAISRFLVPPGPRACSFEFENTQRKFRDGANFLDCAELIHSVKHHYSRLPYKQWFHRIRIRMQ